MYYNARSIVNKLDELSAICSVENPDIVCIVESWLGPEIEDNEIAIASYSIVRLDRNRHGGGVILYIKDSLNFKSISPSRHDLELIFVSVTLQSMRDVCIETFYSEYLGLSF